MEEHLYQIRHGDLVGYIDQYGVEQISPRFRDGADMFVENVAAVEDSTGKWGFVNAAGQWVIPPRFDAAQSFSCGMASVRVEKRYGYVDKEGRFQIPPDLEYAYSFCEGMAQICVNGKSGFIDVLGKTRIPPRYETLGHFSEGLVSVSIGQKVGFLNRDGDIVIDPIWETTTFDTSAILTDSQQCTLGGFTEGLAPVKRDRTQPYLYIDTRGNIVLEGNYSSADNFYEELAYVRLAAGGSAYMDHRGRSKIMLSNHFGYRFQCGLTSIETEYDRYAYINHDGRVVIDVGNLHPGSFRGPLAQVDYGEYTPYWGWGYIDRSGKRIWWSM